MAEKGTTDGAASQESIKHEAELITEKCDAILVRKTPESFPGEGEECFTNFWENFIKEFNPRDWKCVIQNWNHIVIVKCDQSKLYENHSHGLFVLSKYKSFTSSDNTSSSNTAGAAAAAASVDPCDCLKFNSILRSYLNLTSNDEWILFEKCRGITFVSMSDEKTSITVKDFDKLKALVRQLIKLHNDVKNILNTRVPLGETEDKKSTAITTHIVSQEEFFKEINEIVFQKRRILKELNTLVLRLCRTVDVLEDGQDSATKSDGPSTSVANHERSSRKDEKPRGIKPVSSIPLRTLLQCIVTRMTTPNWEDLRRYVGRQIPVRVLRNVPNDIEFFQELENRDMIRIGNTEYIRTGLYDIGRVDLVHLLDCIQEGDYSLLQPDVTSQVSEQANRREDTTSNAESRTLFREMQNLTVDGESGNTADQNVLWQSEANGTSTASQDTTMQRRYRNIPQRTATPPAYPVQEDTEAISSTTANQPAPGTGTSGSEESTITPAQPTDISNVSNQGTGSEDPTPQSEISEVASSQEINVTPEQNTGSGNEEDMRAWMQNTDYSCDHYDRYCTVQFACCDRFWPCHRCHNSQSQCAERKLRSRDIKKVKCRRCGEVQDFPKESPNCVQCNLKFAEYFCPICQHLTGTQNHPFHCNKCGICRVHGDRSFHCDVCGVCLDVNLRGNHRCREGSAHDECCICFEDAFTGCQILPCSHKVHKECATQMVRSGVTRCPICRQSFGNLRIDKSKK